MARSSTPCCWKWLIASSTSSLTLSWLALVIALFAARVPASADDATPAETPAQAEPETPAPTATAPAPDAPAPATASAADSVPGDAPPGDAAPTTVSYARQVLPLFQARCQGCHQPAKSEGNYVMTDFDRLLAGGESEEPAVVPGQVDASRLVALITPVDGAAEMPRKGPPLTEAEVAIIRQWVAEGAHNDAPSSSTPRYDAEHPPRYKRPPVITALDISPDGQLLAVSGFHEVLLHRADGSGLVARLVGMSERIESVKFSPDGSRLAVAGGKPGRMGEVQIWDVATHELLLSYPVTYDTVYGVSWSPDQKLVAFGCADNTVRVIEAETGEQVLYQGSHNDWVFDTDFSVDGTYLVSVGRDMTAKLIEVGTQRFIDNITSITPGALKGGIASVERHPLRDEILFGGADGVPKIYRMHRTTPRKIGDDANLLWELPALPGRVFAVDYSRDATRIAAGSSLDGKGKVRIHGIAAEFDIPDPIREILVKPTHERSNEERESLRNHFSNGIQTIAEADIDCGIYALVFTPDATRLAVGGGDGKLRILDATSGTVIQEFLPVEIEQDDDDTPSEAQASTAPPESTAVTVQATHPDYIRDVMPILSRLGCNAGTCHGSKDGKNGFKLSLRGYDPIFDVRALTDDLASRRVNVASPDESLMLLKATARVPHQGGQVTTADHPYYKILRGWIANGAMLDLNSPRVRSVEVAPLNPVIQRIGERQQLQVTATYSDGSRRDVTSEAFLDSGNTEVLTPVPGQAALFESVRRGEAPVLVRFEGAYAATTITVMGDRDEFVWVEPEANNPIDTLVAAKWKRSKILPSPLCNDYEFVRRLYLDLTGLPPTSEQVSRFVADQRDTRLKRDELIDRLVGSPDYVEHWANKWADLLQVNGKFLGAEGAAAFRQWIRTEIARNTPYDEFARKILTASGSNRENPPASYYKILRAPDAMMENTTHLFLATRFNCNKCHDHPFERWTQDQYYQLAAYFAQVELKQDPASGDRRVGGTSVESAKPLFEMVEDMGQGEMLHERTGQVAEPAVPYPAQFEAPENASRREQLAHWITSPDNAYFARSYVNRMWGYLMGMGIIEPIDDIRAGNPPSNPELLAWLTDEFIRTDFDVQHLVRTICKSRVYQLSIATNRWNEDDRVNFSHAIARRLPAEVIFDTLHAVTGARSQFPGLAEGTRAAALPDVGITLPDGFLGNLGQPARESACECERSNDLLLGPVMALVSGPTVNEAIAANNNAIASLVNRIPDDRTLFQELFLRIVNRPATEAELQGALETLHGLDEEHQALVQLRDEAEGRWAPIAEELERTRQQRIADARAAVEAFRTESAARWEQEAAEREARIAAARSAVDEFKANADEKLRAWEESAAQTTRWIVLNELQLRSNFDSKFEKQDDGSYLATGPTGRGRYILTARPELNTVTGIRIEALADERLPKSGPGRAGDGNFVLSELALRAVQGEGRRADQQPIELEGAAADFSQNGYDVATAIDGRNENSGDGWAISPQTGKSHTATFAFKQPLELGPETRLRLVLNQNFNSGEHLLGRFRVSVTDSAPPLQPGHPDAIQRILATAEGERSDDDRKTLMEYFLAQSPDYQKLASELTEAERPLQPDPELVRLENQLAEAEQPVAIDPDVARLRSVVETSQRQLEQSRLTAAQDLAWALINSPAFLFNH